MGISVSGPILIEEPLVTRYQANSAGAVVLDLVGNIVCLVAPIFICLAMQNFWSLENTYVQMPTVTFTDRCLIRVHMHSGREMYWACSDAVNDELIGFPMSMSPYFSVLSDDHNSDGHNDNFVFSIQVPLSTTNNGVDTVAKIEFLPEFRYIVKNFLFHLDFTTAPFITVTNELSDESNAAILSGDLMFRQTDLISASEQVSYNTRYVNSYFDKVADINDLINIGFLAQKYGNRNESTEFYVKTLVIGSLDILATDTASRGLSNSDFRVSSDIDDAESFELRINMRVPVAMVHYAPAIAEALKWAFMQYVMFWYLLFFIFWYVKNFFVKNALINTIAIWEGVKK